MRQSFYASVALVAAIQAPQPTFVTGYPVYQDYEGSTFTQIDSAIPSTAEHEQMLVQALLENQSACDVDGEGEVDSEACAETWANLVGLCTSIYNLEVPKFSDVIGSVALLPPPPASNVMEASALVAD